VLECLYDEWGATLETGYTTEMVTFSGFCFEANVEYTYDIFGRPTLTAQQAAELEAELEACKRELLEAFESRKREIMESYTP